MPTHNRSPHEAVLTHVNNDIFILRRDVVDRYELRSYESSVFPTFLERLAPGMCVFDIGAHIGLYALAAAKRIGTTGKVFAFEPSPASAHILEHHLVLNGYQDRVEIVRSAVTDTVGVLSFFVRGHSMCASLARGNLSRCTTATRSRVQEIRVPSLTLDSFCTSRSIAPSIMKIDVEGGELRVLKGARSLLLQDHDVAMICEIHPREMARCGATESALHAYVTEVGYQLLSLQPPNLLGIRHGLIVREKPEATTIPSTTTVEPRCPRPSIR